MVINCCPKKFVFRKIPILGAIKHFKNEFKTSLELDHPSLRKDDLICKKIEHVESVGLKRFVFFEEILEKGFGSEWRRALVQREYHELCSIALAPLIFGKDWERDGPELMRLRGWNTHSQLVLCKLPRRFGKSVGTAMIMAAVAICFIRYPPPKNFIISSFSTGRRASTGLSDYFKQLIQAAGYAHRYGQNNKETCDLHSGNDDINDDDNEEYSPLITLNFFPSNPKISPFS